MSKRGHIFDGTILAYVVRYSLFFGEFYFHILTYLQVTNSYLKLQVYSCKLWEAAQFCNLASKIDRLCKVENSKGRC